MKELVKTVTSKGQVTIPVEVRRLLGIAPRAKVAFIVEDSQVRLAPASSIVERTAGSLRSRKTVKSAKQLRRVAEQAISDEVVERN